MITLTAKIEVNYFIIGESRLGEGAAFGSVSSGAKTEIIINQRNLISLESSIFDRSDIKLPSWGIISNVGYLKFNDKHREIKDLAEHKFLTSNQKVSIFLNNTLSKKSSKVHELYTTTWEYDTDNGIASVSLKDDLAEWQDIMIDGISYDPTDETARTCADVYKYLYSQTPSKYNMMSYDELDSETKNILSSSLIPYYFINKGNLWASWNKLCSVCQLYIFKHITTKCMYNKGN